MGKLLNVPLQQLLTNKAVLTCMATICIARFSTTVLNMGIYPDVASYFGMAREINTFAGALAMIALALAVGKKPAIVDAKTFSAIAALLLVFGCIILTFAVSSGNNALTVIGLCSATIARNWTIIMLYAALSSLKSREQAVLAVGGGVLAGFALYPLAEMLTTTQSIVANCILSCCTVYPLYRITAPTLKAVASGASSSEMQIMNPFSFLGPTHPVLVAILLFNIAFGFSLSLNIRQTMPVELSVIGAAFVLVSVVILLRRKGNALDSLFSLATLLIVAGYIVSVAFLGTSNPLANTILTAGSAIFSILVYLVISSVIARNPWGAIPLAAWSIAFGGLGTLLGADVGHILNSMAMRDSQAATLSICAVLMMFVSYLWLAMRHFSFDKTVEGVASVRTEAPHAIDDRFEDDVTALGKRHGLTEREIEILLLLAKGRNSVFLQEHFVVSKNTIKTHIKHIYRKLDVHSQQEVIDLIEQHRCTR